MKIRLILAILLAAGTLSAQRGDNSERGRGGRGEPPTAEEFIERLDQDDDGKVSQEEFDGPDEHFATFDKNEDGYISEDEVPTGPPPRGRQ